MRMHGSNGGCSARQQVAPPGDSKPRRLLHLRQYPRQRADARPLCAVYNALNLLKSEQELLRRISIYIIPRVAVGGAAGAGSTRGQRQRGLCAGGGWGHAKIYAPHPGCVAHGDLNSALVGARSEHRTTPRGSCSRG